MEMKVKTYIGISRDHSGSMRNLAELARKDYNANLATMKNEAKINNQETIVSVIRCGVGTPARNEREVVNTNVNYVNECWTYSTTGTATPLFDSVSELIDMMASSPDAYDPTTAFLVMVITDGYNNAGKVTGPQLGIRIQELQKTDRWTFVFRVPPGCKKDLVALGIPDLNILEWELSQQGIEKATQITTSSLSGYYSARNSGETSTRSFFQPDLTKVNKEVLQRNLVDISNEVNVFHVDYQDGGKQIRDFCEAKTGKPYTTGSAFYQLTKLETVQSYKKVCILEKLTGKVYTGEDAKSLLGLPLQGNFKIKPGSYSNYDIFIQSTSFNRKLVYGTKVLYWYNVR